MTSANSLLELQTEQLNQLATLLQAELDAFKQRNPDAIYDIAGQKAKLLENIQQVDIDLSKLDSLEALKQDESFMNHVSQLTEQLTEIKIQSSINERVIRTSLNNVTRLKQSILALKNADSMTYDKQGQAQTQTLGKGIKA